MVRTAVVTGAGRGIGKEIARGLVARGYLVLVTDVDAQAAGRTAAELGDAAWPMALDVRDAGAHRAAAAEAAARGTLSVWVNNAGVLRAGGAWQLTDDEVRLLVEANVLGVMSGSRAAVEAMRDTGGHILTIASLSSLGPAPGLSVYGATKHAVLAFMTSLQGELDLAGIPIRVHSLCPDGVATDMVAEHRHEAGMDLVFSGGDLLSPEAVAGAAVAMLDGTRIVATLPRGRGVLARSVAPFPRAGLTILRVLRRSGERRRRAAAAAG